MSPFFTSKALPSPLGALSAGPGKTVPELARRNHGGMVDLHVGSLDW